MSKKKALPIELFWPPSRIPVEGAYGVFPFVYPCRRTYLSFFREMSRQISKQITQKIGKEPDPYICISSSSRLKRSDYFGEPYMAELFFDSSPDVWDHYSKNIQLCYKNYLYSEMEFSNVKGRDYGVGYFWIRWKSLRPDYEYINFDSGLELTDRDIVFELCTKLPKKIEKQAKDLYEKSEYKADCNSWIHGGVQNIQKVLPTELFVPYMDYSVFPVEDAFTVKLPLDPCRKVYLPFFAELSQQITQQVIRKIGKNPDPYLCLCLDSRFKQQQFVGENYIIKKGDREETLHTYRWHVEKLHYKGYAYAEIGFSDQWGRESFAGYLWIRWKSLRPEYEYIDYDSGLELTDKDIRFEICTELPEEIIKQAKELYEEPEFAADCNAWIEQLRNWKNVLPPELFVSKLEEGNWRRRGTFNMALPVRPCRKAYLPFFRELNTQISKQIMQLTGKRPDKSLYLSVNWRLLYNGGSRGDYYADWDDLRLLCVRNTYVNDMIKLHCNGYSYAEIGLGCLKSNAKDPGDFWIRWKSLRPEYEYIDYDCGLELTDKDIRFEICTELPEEIAKKAESLYRSPDFKVDCNSWIDSLKNGTYLPKPRKKLQKNTKPMFPYDLSEECAYPDVFYTLWFESGITDGLKERVEAAFVNFMDIWNEKHEEDAIHDIADAADIIEVPADAICYAVDFGNADPKAVINLLKHLHNSDLGISKARVS